MAPCARRSGSSSGAVEGPKSPRRPERMARAAGTSQGVSRGRWEVEPPSGKLLPAAGEGRSRAQQTGGRACCPSCRGAPRGGHQEGRMGEVGTKGGARDRGPPQVLLGRFFPSAASLTPAQSRHGLGPRRRSSASGRRERAGLADAHLQSFPRSVPRPHAITCILRRVLSHTPRIVCVTSHER